MKSRNDNLIHGARGRLHARRAFTLIELLVAGVIAAFLLGSIAMSMSQLARARNTSKLRFDAFMRADTALNMLRRDIVSVLRRDDLFFTRFLLTHDADSIRAGTEQFERDGILVFNTRLRALRDIDFNGEGFEYETQYRVADDDGGPELWVRRDAVPDEYPQGGGLVTPAVEGILSLRIEAYDGQAWYDDWDSDAEGLPVAVKITVVASGHRDISDVYTAPRAVLQTMVPIDRVISPKDLFKSPEDDQNAAADDQNSDQNADNGGNNDENGGGDFGGRPGGRPGPGGGRPGDGRPGRPPADNAGGGRGGHGGTGGPANSNAAPPPRQHGGNT